MRRRLLMKCLFTLSLVATAALGAGCWDRIEVQTLAFVTEAGIDPAVETEENPFGWESVELSVRVANTASAQDSGTGASSTSLGALVVGRGVSPLDALNDIQSASGRIIYVAHNRAAVVSSQLAQAGRMTEVIDFFDRSRQARRSAYLLVADGLSAREVISLGSQLSDQESSAIFELARFNHRTRGMPIVTINDFIVRATQEGVDPIAIRVSAAPMLTSPAESGSSEPQGGPSAAGGRQVEIAGAALFRKDVLVGYLDEDATRGLLWARGDLSSGSVNVPCPAVTEKSFGFLVRRSSGAVTIETDPELRGKVTITMEGDFVGLSCPGGGYKSTSQAVQVAQERLKARVEESVRAAIAKSQQLQADPFGFGAALMRKEYGVWRRVKERWYDTVWPELPVDIEIKVDIRRPGLVGPPYQVDR